VGPPTVRWLRRAFCARLETTESGAGAGPRPASRKEVEKVF
jgi:hypothetical protein